MEEEDEKEEIKILSHFNLGLSPELAYFRKKYWAKRNDIFQELYNILYNKEDPVNEEELEEECGNSSNDSFSDIQNFDNKKLEVFKGNNSDLNDDFDSYTKKDEEKKDESQNFLRIYNKSQLFIENSKQKMYQNYLKNYKDKNYKFSDNKFSLYANEKEIFFRINRIDVLKIDYLVKIKINSDKKEWVCNSYYGLYLLYKIKKCKNPYTANEDDFYENKTISKYEDFDLAIADGIIEFIDLEYEIDLENIIEDITKYHSCSLIKQRSKYKDYLNLKSSKLKNNGNFNFLISLFENRALQEYTYIFGNDNTLQTYDILYSLIECQKQNNLLFLYLDFDYINKIHKRSDLKQYFAFWLPRIFLCSDYDKFKKFFGEIVDSIDFSEIPNIIKKIIEFIQITYKQKLYIFLNNVNSKKEHGIIAKIMNIVEPNDSHYFLIIGNIEEEYNIKKFFNLYFQKYIKIIILNSIYGNNQDDLDINIINEIKALFSAINITNFTDLIKLFNFNEFMQYKQEKFEIDMSELFFIKKYIKYINLIVDNNFSSEKTKIIDINFKNKNIENEFLRQYENYALYFIESDKRLEEILNINDGELFESLIISDILTEKIIKNNNWLNLERIQVNSLFGLIIDEGFDFEKYKGKNVLFTQKSKTGEIFDFAILINIKGSLIMKLFQISKNKSQDDFEKLDVDIIQLHCANIKKNLKKLGEIKYFTFGIITSKTNFDNYLNDKSKNSEYKLMKEMCNKKNFELVIYNLKEKAFYFEEKIEESKDENNKNVNNEDNKLLLYDIISFNEIYKINIPNYDSIFDLNPRFITTKNINFNYSLCIGKYLNSNLKENKVKIIGKIDYNKQFINSEIKDKNIGLLISGTIKSNIFYNKKRSDQLFKRKETSKIRLIKEKGKNTIYEEKETNGKINEIKEIKQNLTNPHIILFKFEEKDYLGKKRNSKNLFLEDVIKPKKIKK